MIITAANGNRAWISPCYSAEHNRAPTHREAGILKKAQIAYLLSDNQTIRPQDQILNKQLMPYCHYSRHSQMTASTTSWSHKTGQHVHAHG
jgi:hypothetical protein